MPSTSRILGVVDASAPFRILCLCCYLRGLATPNLEDHPDGRDVKYGCGMVTKNCDYPQVCRRRLLTAVYQLTQRR